MSPTREGAVIMTLAGQINPHWCQLPTLPPNAPPNVVARIPQSEMDRFNLKRVK